IRTFVEEYLRLQKVFDSVAEMLEDFVYWFNNRRYHLGICGYPQMFIYENRMLPMLLDIT
ncbi:MAG: hypothetical protein J7K13_05935, partial [Thermoplasmata archaeon]|nr:hypothetical protein [Thermoplasmata archaeon]